MKPFKYKYLYHIILAAVLFAGITSCDDFLDKEPMSNISPEKYYSSAAQLDAILMDLYPHILPSHSNWSYGIYGEDNGTDNQIGVTANNRYTTDRWLVPNSESNNWAFNRIYHVNFYLTQTLEKFGESMDGSESVISGNNAHVKHYIGEMYFLRALEYFKKLQMFGDFPIITEPLPDDMEVLAEASKRFPRNEVARFIMDDLDKAYTYMGDVDFNTTRINKDVALLLKSRVALFEGTWLKNFKGTAFVPGGEDWPGTEQHPSYSYPAGSIDNEVTWFLTQAADAAKTVGDKYKGSLTPNTGTVQQSEEDAANPYFNMFADEDLSEYPEVMLWRQYARGLVTHNVNAAAGRGNYRIGLTRGYVQNFLMADGTPLYTNGSYEEGNGYYMGDQTIADVRANRDTRLSLFLKEPGQKNILFEVNNPEGTEAVMTEPYPAITLGDSERGYATGYALRKGGSLNKKHYANGGGYTASIAFRSVEALLNYIEASYLLNGTIDATAAEYWSLIRQRAGVDPDFNKTISLTDMSKEAENDWGAFTAGSVITDPTLYNIRRERRSELLAEGFRYMDLRRWRSMDQLIDEPYHMEGFHLWNSPMQEWYNESDLVYNEGTNSTVSPPEKSEYLRPFERYSGQAGFEGCTWRMAHYLEPIMIKQFLLTSPNGNDPTQSTIYQNPYWPLEAGVPAVN
ncbi:RagB/SusD family nutrient uptake outer membrane protein [Dysgonomonadaceae bacterium zrk40]|nr:RagB/SusD family nutrient uptake outer membrane protein [Dysgonomonadaceae bacterium zrk40]